MSFILGYLMGLGDSEAKLTTIGIYRNGEYKPPSGFDGFEKVTVNVVPAVESLYVTEPGTYSASDNGCDGFDPVTVSDIYKRLYEQSVGSGENVTDDNGNEIPNAVTSNDIDELNEYLTHIEFGAYGGSVTCQGLDGDTSFTVEMHVKKLIYPGEQIRYSTNAKLTVTNLITGETSEITSTAYQTGADSQPPHKMKITKITKLSNAYFQVGYQIINSAAGAVIANSNFGPQASWVNGTCFVQSKAYAAAVS